MKNESDTPFVRAVTKTTQEVVCGDCLPIMKGYKDKQFDLVLCDPPYGIGEAAGRNKSRGLLAISKDYGDEEWDNKKISTTFIPDPSWEWDLS